MNEILVKLRTATAQAQLYPRYDRETNILEVENPTSKAWPYGIDIDGRIIFDIDTEFILSNIDIMIPQRMWKVSNSIEKPRAQRKANLEFSQLSIKQKSYHLPIEVWTNQVRSKVTVLIGKPEQEAFWITLSDRCLASVAEDRLKGFFLSLM